MSPPVLPTLSVVRMALISAEISTSQTLPPITHSHPFTLLPLHTLPPFIHSRFFIFFRFPHALPPITQCRPSHTFSHFPTISQASVTLSSIRDSLTNHTFFHSFILHSVSSYAKYTVQSTQHALSSIQSHARPP
jgi:hypothetical protein